MRVALLAQIPSQRYKYCASLHFLRPHTLNERTKSSYSTAITIKFEKVANDFSKNFQKVFIRFQSFRAIFVTSVLFFFWRKEKFSKKLINPHASRLHEESFHFSSRNNIPESGNSEQSQLLQSSDTV